MVYSINIDNQYIFRTKVVVGNSPVLAGLLFFWAKHSQLRAFFSVSSTIKTMTQRRVSILLYTLTLLSAHQTLLCSYHVSPSQVQQQAQVAATQKATAHDIAQAEAEAVIQQIEAKQAQQRAIALAKQQAIALAKAKAQAQVVATQKAQARALAIQQAQQQAQQKANALAKQLASKQASTQPIKQVQPQVVVQLKYHPYARIFACLRHYESGNNYAENTGNGYYGAYQFSVATWQSVGGTGLPSLASPATQNHFARVLQRRSGWSQWQTAPLCGV